MPDVGKRSYVSAVRDSQARRTRRQIVAAAGRLYAEQGFSATTIDAIAAEAGVSRKTVFTAVGGKVALLKLAYDFAMAGDDEPVPMIEREGLQSIMAEPDPYEQMRMYAEFVTSMGERTGALWLALRGAAEVDDEARELYTRWDQQRLDGMRTGPVRDLLAKGAIRSDLTPDEAAAIFWVLTDPVLYHRLVVERRLAARPVPGLAARGVPDPDSWLHTQRGAEAADAAARARRRPADHMPGIGSSSSVSMVPPIVLCGWLSSTAASASGDSACMIE